MRESKPGASERIQIERGMRGWEKRSKGKRGGQEPRGGPREAHHQNDRVLQEKRSWRKGSKARELKRLRVVGGDVERSQDPVTGSRDAESWTARIRFVLGFFET